MAGVELVADADATEQEGLITLVSLLADGVEADSTNVSLSVKKAVRDVTIGLELPRNIRLPVGGKTTILVQVRRNGYVGPITLEVEDLPTGVRATTATVAEDEDSGTIVLTAHATTGPRLDLQLFRVIARVDNKRVGIRDGTFLLTHKSGVAKPLPEMEKPLPPPKEDGEGKIALKALQGTWTVVAPRPMFPKTKRGPVFPSLTKIVIEGNQWTYFSVRNGVPQTDVSYEIVLDPTKDPMWIDLKSVSGEVSFRGVYAVKRNSLKVLFSRTVRPKSLPTPSPRSLVITLIRDKS